MPRRLKRDLEKILATQIQMTLGGETIIDVPLEALYHVQAFLRKPIPCDVEFLKNLLSNKQ